MSNPIPLNLDAYGNYARASALADYLELRVLAGMPAGQSWFADQLADAKATRRMNDMFVGDEENSEGDEDDAGEGATGEGPGMAQAQKVFDLLLEREEVLEDAYPFVVTKEDHLVLREPRATALESMYVALLTLTVAHAYDIKSAHDPKRVLEATVTRSLSTIGLNALNLGQLSRGAGDFRNTVQKAGEALGLRASPLGAPTLRHANEEGVDCVGHLPAAVPRRGGSWVFLGQATCGQSETWDSKLDQPKPSLWSKLLNTGVPPLAFLAVPHHVEPIHLRKLVDDAQRIVLDRLRLTTLAGHPSVEEKAIRNAVLAAGMEQLV